MTPEAIFQQRQQHFRQVSQTYQQAYNRLAMLRLGVFGVGLALAWLFWQQQQLVGVWVAAVLTLLGFLGLLTKHQRIRRERDRAQRAVAVNEDELGRLQRQYQRAETGEAFMPEAHPYAADLDIFGKNSLFRLLNRAHTYQGQRRLADWLLYPASPQIIAERQQAIQTLTPLLDWRQQLETLADDSIGQSPGSLIQWATSPAPSLPAYVPVGRWLLPLIHIGVFGAWLMGYTSGWAVVAALGFTALLLRQTAKYANEVSEQTYTVSEGLRQFQDLFAHIETLPAAQTPMAAIQQPLTQNGQTASAAIRRLARLTAGLNYRRNPYFMLLLGMPMAWDWHYLQALTAWKRQHGRCMAQWFSALAEVEALNSLSGFAFAHPAYTWPSIAEGDVRLTMTQAAHPLLPPIRSVANSFELAGAGQTLLITGSNMSGKSTFLRTVALNVVLALAGSVVSAAACTCSPMRVFTSMRTQDSLEESTSSFYAELKRLQWLIELTHEREAWPVLYFLDEILKGTNSADRHRGAEALIRQLHQTTASGFVSTHDLALGQLSDTQSFVKNFHFQSDLQNGQLHFDYTLRPGICTSFNASQLMQAIGIQMDLAGQ